MILKKISRKGDLRTGRISTLLIFNGDMDNVIKIVEWLGKWGLLIDVATKTVKHEIKLTRTRIFLRYDSTYGFLIDATGSFDKCCIWKMSHENQKRARRWNYSGFGTTFIKAIPLKGYNNTDHINNNF